MLSFVRDNPALDIGSLRTWDVFVEETGSKRSSDALQLKMKMLNVELFIFIHLSSLMSWCYSRNWSPFSSWEISRSLTRFVLIRLLHWLHSDRNQSLHQLRHQIIYETIMLTPHFRFLLLMRHLRRMTLLLSKIGRLTSVMIPTLHRPKYSHLTIPLSLQMKQFFKNSVAAVERNTT